MLAITYTPEDLRLLEAAEIAESSEKYNQWSLGLSCDAPACLLGGYAWKHPESAARAYITDHRFQNFINVAAEFGIREMGQWHSLFSVWGCDHAGTDGKKAAAYVRRFVRERGAARLMK
jgi:hypothetical protein